MTDPAILPASGAPSEAPPKSNWKRNTAAITLMVISITMVMGSLAGGVLVAAVLTALAAALAWLLTSWGKAIRLAKLPWLPGSLIAIGAVILLMASSSFMTAKQDEDMAKEFAASGPRRIAQASAALGRGDYETARAVLEPVATFEDPRIKRLTFAINALTSAKGNVEQAVAGLQVRSANTKEDKALYIAAVGDLSPQVAARIAEKANEDRRLAEEAARQKDSGRRVAAQEAADQAKYGRFFSQWDGSHPQIVAQVKEQMSDPDSFKHVSTEIRKGAEGNLAVVMTYRGKNGFGGVVTERVGGVVSGEDGRLLALAQLD